MFLAVRPHPISKPAFQNKSHTPRFNTQYLSRSAVTAPPPGPYPMRAYGGCEECGNCRMQGSLVQGIGTGDPGRMVLNGEYAWE